LAGVKFLLKKERVFFFRGSALEVSGQVARRNTDAGGMCGGFFDGRA